MSNQSITGERSGIALRQIKANPTKINQCIDERITAAPQLKRLISVLTELVPGFEERLRQAETEGKREL